MRKTLLTFLLLYCGLAAAARDEPVANDDAMNNLAIYAISLADTPYRYGGNTPDTGFDCSGFVRYVFEQTSGRSLPRTSQEMSKLGEQLQQEELLPGDLVFFNTRRQPYSHVGIYVGEDRFVHSPKPGKAIMVVNMREPYWRKRYNGARRMTTD